jgi:CheY-like chemotaxis protein
MGSTFVVTLPLAAGARSEPVAAAPELPVEHAACSVHARLDGVRLLVVDNEPDVLELVAKVLADSGALVSTSDSAREALQLMECRTFDLLVLDIAMPETDGYALMREIRTREAARGGAVPAIALTACAHADERARAFASGFQCHLAKPIEPPALVSAVAALARPGA